MSVSRTGLRKPLSHEPHGSGLASWQDASSQSGLEVDRATNAPEAVRYQDAPEVAIATGPEVHFSKLPPIVVDEETKEVYQPIPPQTTARLWGIPKRRAQVIIGIIGLVLIALAIAVGVGVGIGRKGASSDRASPAVPDGTPSSPTSTQSPSLPSTSILPPVQHGALKDSSLAAYTLNDGSRSLVFQDSNGTVRQLIYTQGSSAWTANSAFAVIATDAKNSTPLAVAVVPQQIEDTTHVYVIYITVNNTLAAKRLITGGSNNLNSISWDIPDPNLSGAFADLSDFAVSKSSKQLSVSVLPNTTNLEVCLFYENPHGNLSIVHGELLPQPGTTQLLWSWTNVSTDQMIFKTVVIGNATLGPPFSSGIVSISEPLSDTDQFYSISKNLSHLSLTYTYGRPDAFGIMESYYANNSLAEGLFNAFGPTANSDFEAGLGGQLTGYPIGSEVLTSDIVRTNINTTARQSNGQYTFWVNGTTLAGRLDADPASMPSTAFPYQRLAATSPGSSGLLYLYHQMNVTTMAEETWDDVAASWNTSFITINLP